MSSSVVEIDVNLKVVQELVHAFVQHSENFDALYESHIPHDAE
jgi:hypothetical protein